MDAAEETCRIDRSVLLGELPLLAILLVDVAFGPLRKLSLSGSA
ncbi:MAG: hypothetical protein ACYDBY_19630 [Thermoanaerobaculia bacterium]